MRRPNARPARVTSRSRSIPNRPCVPSAARSRLRSSIRVFARVYAGWAWSQTFFRQSLDRERLGFANMEAFLTHAWEPSFLAHDANDLLAMLATWQAADISVDPRFNGDIERALAATSFAALPIRDHAFSKAGGSRGSGRPRTPSEHAPHSADP